jgi:hypothetical protein
MSKGNGTAPGADFVQDDLDEMMVDPQTSRAGADVEGGRSQG